MRIQKKGLSASIYRGRDVKVEDGAVGGVLVIN